MAKGNSAIVINSNNLFKFYRYWLEFMRPLDPIAQLSPKQLEVLATFLYKRNEIEKGVVDEKLITKLLWSVDVRNSILESASISKHNYYNVISFFKKIGIIVDGDLNKKVIPELVNNKFSLIISFNVEDR